MPASRRLWLALEIGLAALVVTLAAYGVSAALRVATVDETTPRFAPESSASDRAHAPGPLESYGVIATRDRAPWRVVPKNAAGLARGLSLGQLWRGRERPPLLHLPGQARQQRTCCRRFPPILTNLPK